MLLKDFISDFSQPHIEKEERRQSIIERGKWCLGTTSYGEMSNGKILIRNTPTYEDTKTKRTR